jgi:CHAT domain-containing protein/predicted negative regulator of RcsB-dependent stress response
MQLSHRVGLVLLVNLSIVSGAILPGVAAAENSVVAQAPRSDELETAIAEGLRLYKEGSKTSLMAAIQQFERALQLSRAEAQKARRAVALVALGRIYDDLGEKSKALEYYNQALPIFRAVENQSMEATTLNNMGLVYFDLDEQTKALEYYNQALPILRDVENRSMEAITLNNMGLVYSAMGEKTKALEYYNQALPIFRAVNNPTMEATTLNSIGLAYYGLGEPQKALEFYNQTLPIYRALYDRLGEATFLNNVGQVYSILGKSQKALESYNQALPILRAVNDPSGEATVLNNIGQVYSTLSKPQKALEFYNQALPILRAVNNRTMEATTLNNIGQVYYALGDPKRALEFYNQSLPLSITTGNRLMEATILDNIGQAYDDLGEKQKALESYNQSLPLSRAVSNRLMEATTLNNIGLVYYALGEPKIALEFYNQSLQLSSNIGNRLGEATTLGNIGQVYDILGEKQKALEFDNQALLILRDISNRSGEATILSNISSIYYTLGENQKALEFNNQALPILRAVGNRLGEATTLTNLGSVHYALGQPQEALEFYNQSLPISRAMGNRSGEVSTLGHLAMLYRSQNKMTDALQNVNTAIQIIESLRSELKTDALKTAYFASVQGHYQFKTEILMQLHQQQPTKGYDAAALETVDQSRARVLRELLIQANANIKKDIAPDLLKQEQTLNQTLNAKETQLVQLSNQPNQAAQIPALNQAITALYAQRDDLQNTIRVTNPAYANLQYPKPITLKAIQQQLDPDTLMLQYSLGEKESYLWVIGQTTLKTYILPKRTDIEQTAQTFRKELIAQRPAPKSATQLTQQLLTPAAADLGNKRLVIIPDGILHTIPFAALNTPNSTTYNPLLTQHEITNLPSASTIGILRTTVATKPRGPKQLAILADPIFRKDDPRLTGKTTQANNNLDLGEQIARSRVGRDLDLNRLPFTATEAKGILALVPNQDSTAAFGFDASYDWITNPKISQYRYVHLATHGFFDNDKPALSSIILSSFDAQGHDRKAFLRFPDLFNLNLPTELVVLSACETGLGNNVPGEGLVGMTRGLMYAGALRVAVSLWSVDDQATSDLMQDFYKNLWQAKKSHAASLREAQIKLHQQGKAPYYWAAFTLQGEWRN